MFCVACGVKKEPIDISNLNNEIGHTNKPIVYKLISEKKTTVNEGYEPIEKNYFVYKNYNEILVIYPDGKLKSLCIFKNQKINVDSLALSTTTNGVFYRKKDKMFMEIDSKRQRFTFQSDSIIFKNEEKIFKKII